ncbi:MAG: adenylate/guanylate cyclase domain-containing protein, partial [Pseudomonadota bacterium]
MSDRGAVLSDIASWLHQHGLGLLSEVFEANHIDLSTLPDLTEQDFRDLGLSVGHRRKLVQAIRSLETAPPAEAERRQITVLFVDIVGYTLLARRLDPEELLDTMRVYHAACGRIVGLHGGSVIEYVGDGVVALFGWPVASEHDARSAVLSGLDIQKEIEKLKLVNSG